MVLSKISGKSSPLVTKLRHSSCSGGSSGRVRGIRNSGIPPLPPPPSPLIRPDPFLRLKFLHRQNRVLLFNWLIFLMKRALHFATKLNSRDIQKCNCFGYPPMSCSPLLAKQSFPSNRRPATGDRRSQIEKHVVVSVRNNLPQKSSTVVSDPQ